MIVDIVESRRETDESLNRRRQSRQLQVVVSIVRSREFRWAAGDMRSLKFRPTSPSDPVLAGSGGRPEISHSRGA